MELNHDFDVAVPLDEAWTVLTDLERIAPCLPGAQLQEVEGDEYRGTVKVKVGPITAQYKGTATFESLDRDAGRAVVQAKGRDTKGQGNASATIVATLTETDGGTHVDISTDLRISGKVAQFGRGAIADVSSTLMTEFVERLETTVLGDGGSLGNEAAAAQTSSAQEPETQAPDSVEPTALAAPSAATNGSSVTATTATPSAGPRRIDSPEAEPIDLLATVGGTRSGQQIGLAVVAVVILGLIIALCRCMSTRPVVVAAGTQSSR